MTDTTTTEDSDLIAELLLQADKLLASERLLYGEAKASTAIVKVVDRFNQLLTDNAALKEEFAEAKRWEQSATTTLLTQAKELDRLKAELEQVKAHLQRYQDKYGFSDMAMDSAIQEFNAQARPDEA